MAVGISSWRQRSNNAIPPAVKATASYMNSILAKMEAKAHGYAEAIMLNEAGLVCEGTGENLFIVRNGVLSTPPLSDGLLEGITRDTVLCLADDLEIPAVEESLTRSDLYIADEVFMTGSAAELTPWVPWTVASSASPAKPRARCRIGSSTWSTGVSTNTLTGSRRSNG